MTPPRPFWDRLVSTALELRVVGFMLVAMLIVAGAVVSPIDPDVPGLPRHPVPVDALPDVGENQQIVFTEWPGRSPQDVEDQLTYPLTTALLGVPGVRTVRSRSALGFSTISVVFEDDVEFYWSRSRVLEKLAALPQDTLPDGVSPTLGPDATALGQVFWYTLEGHAPDGTVVGGWDPDELRTLQDWTVRYALASVDGVAEVSSVGGFVREYQVDADPDAMQAHGVSILQVADAMRKANLDVGARTMEINGVEYLVRGVGFIDSLSDIEDAVVVARDDTPVRIMDVAHVSLGPALRRGALDDAGAPAVGGIVVARYLENPRAVVDRIEARIEQLQPGLPRRTLDDGTVSQVTIVPCYNRATLIDETLGTLSTALLQQVLVTLLVVLVVLRDLRAAAVVSLLLPVGVLGTFVVMKATGVDANIMALGGIAIAIGTMVDIGIVFTESVVQHTRAGLPDQSRQDAVRKAISEVAPAVFTSVATTVVGFLPVFGLTPTELRLFAPLAATKTAAMAVAFIVTVVVLPGAAWLLFRPEATNTSDPGWRRLFQPGHVRDWLLLLLGVMVGWWVPVAGVVVAVLSLWRLVRPVVAPKLAARIDRLERGATIALVAWLLVRSWMPLGHRAGLVVNLLFAGVLIAAVLGVFRLFERVYPRLLAAALAHRARFALLPGAIVAFGVLAWVGVPRLVSALPVSVQASSPVSALSEAIPGLGREYMPPFDEGAFLYMPSTMPHASIGEALAMMSTLDAALAQVPEVDRVVGKLGRADSALDPAPVSMIETLVTLHPEHRTLPDGTTERVWRDHIRSTEDIWRELTQAAQVPGLTGAPVLMPIAARIVMLESGLRGPMGVKIQGPDQDTIEQFALQVEAELRTVPEVRAEAVFADRITGKPYLEIDLDRQAIGRVGLTVVDVQRVLQVALGGETLTRTVEGRERYPVRVRATREDRDSPEALARLLIPTPSGAPLPLSQLADIRFVRGPQVIQSEDTFLTTAVLFDRAPGVAEVDAVEAAQAHLDAAVASGRLPVPEGVSLSFAGTYQNQVRSAERLRVLVPVALALIFILLYLQFRRSSTVLIVGSGVLVAISGAFALMWLYGVPGLLDVSVAGTSLAQRFHVGPVHLSVAVWVGIIALAGIATDDGVVMATYLRQATDRDPPHTKAELRARTLEAGTRRLRPCLMTTATTLLALLPVVTSQGRGADVMVPIALPIVGGMGVALVTLFVVPVAWSAVEERRLASD